IGDILPTSGRIAYSRPVQTAAASQRIYCEAAGEYSDPDACDLITSAPLGVAVLGTEPEMKITKPPRFYDVTLIVGRQERQEQIEAAVSARGSSSTGQIRLGQW